MWYLIDAARPDRVVRHTPGEGPARERSLQRAVRPGFLTALAEVAVAEAVDSGRSCARRALIRGESFDVVAAPIAGYGGVVAAVRLWVGAAGTPREDPPPADVFLWHGSHWTLRSSGNGGAVLPAGHPLLHGAWFLSRVLECEGRDRLIAAALAPEPGAVWEGPMRVLTADGGIARIYGWFRYHAPDRLRGLLLRVEAGHEPDLAVPAHHHDTTATLLGGTTALIDLRNMQIIEWLTPPLPGIAWRHHPASRGTEPPGGSDHNLLNSHVVHPDDREDYLRVIVELAESRQDSGHAVVRLLTVEGGWVPVELYAVRHAGAPDRFLSCLIQPVDGVGRP
ncbi:GAF domain-containing protein [Nocardia sp. BMG111209]|uniref:GAF domain-containing protein n=1 Tax=Nocardia sp. BMG111209 TaxID=1160137 RepID=UPI000378C9DA|nr:GAF domain-containing protein [Nocardia sp. BMG111209]